MKHCAFMDEEIHRSAADTFIGSPSLFDFAPHVQLARA